MRKKEVCSTEIYARERGATISDPTEGSSHTKSKDLLNLVVVGHVDSGKSTLMGHLLFELGQGMYLICRTFPIFVGGIS